MNCTTPAYCARTQGVIADFEKLLQERTDDIFSQPFFEALSHGLKPEEWKVYAKQFNATCIGFDKLLEATLKSAQQTGSAHLIQELADNLADERGEGQPSAVSHKILRSDFFKAIGLPESEMTAESGPTLPLLLGTINHMATVEQIIQDGCLPTQVGAFAAQEYLACGPGFEILVEGVTVSFPDIANPGHKAMRYVFGHINCDGEKHFPHLLDAMAPMMEDSESGVKIYQGARAMLAAEMHLYTSFEQDLLALDWQKEENAFQKRQALTP